MSTWRTKEWQEASANFVKDKKCEWCNTTENLVPHHPKKKGGYTREEYLSLDGCIVLCSKCNFAEHKKLKLCQICKKHYYKSRRKRGKDQMCWICFSKTEYGKSVTSYYEKHPDKLKKKLRKMRKEVKQK